MIILNFATIEFSCATTNFSSPLRFSLRSRLTRDAAQAALFSTARWRRASLIFAMAMREGWSSIEDFLDFGHEGIYYFLAFCRLHACGMALPRRDSFSPHELAFTTVTISARSLPPRPASPSISSRIFARHCTDELHSPVRLEAAFSPLFEVIEVFGARLMIVVDFFWDIGSCRFRCHWPHFALRLSAFYEIVTISMRSASFGTA